MNGAGKFGRPFSAGTARVCSYPLEKVKSSVAYLVANQTGAITFP